MDMADSAKKAILQLAREQNGRVRTRDITAAGIRREALALLLESGELFREARGIYRVPEQAADPYFVLQKNCSKAIFSYESALGLLGFMEEVEGEFRQDIISVTVQQGYNLTRLKHVCTNLIVHYVQPRILELGLEHMGTPQGNFVRAYNLERCICDFVKHKDQTEPAFFAAILKCYFQGAKKDLRRLQGYAREFGLEEKILGYMEFLM